MLAACGERGLRIGLLSNTLWTREHHEYVLARDGILDLLRRRGLLQRDPVDQAAPGGVPGGDARPSASTTRAACVFVGDRPFDDIHGAEGGRHARGAGAALDIPDDQKGHTEGDPDAVVELAPPSCSTPALTPLR